MAKMVYFLFLIFLGVLAEAKTTSPKTSKQIKGHYVWGHEVNTFTPCGDKKTFWVEGSSASIEKLKTKHQSLTSKPYEKIYATVVGRINLSREELDGFAADYDGLISIDSVESMSKSKGSDCK